jgi:hypothetical protein
MCYFNRIPRFFIPLGMSRVVKVRNEWIYVSLGNCCIFELPRKIAMCLRAFLFLSVSSLSPCLAPSTKQTISQKTNFEKMPRTMKTHIPSQWDFNPLPFIRMYVLLLKELSQQFLFRCLQVHWNKITHKM